MSRGGRGQRNLGNLERERGRHEAARTAYTEALALYKAEGARLGEANVLFGLGRLAAGRDAELAKQHFYQAAALYEAISMAELGRRAVEEARNLAR